MTQLKRYDLQCGDGGMYQDADPKGEWMVADEVLADIAKKDAAFEDLLASNSEMTQHLAAAEHRLDECITEMSLALQDHAVRSAMTVVGRTRFFELVRAHNAKKQIELESGE